MVDEMHARIGEPVRRDDVVAQIKRTDLSETALFDAEARGWLRPVGSQFVEITRRGYVGVNDT